ncbi:1-phosphofructokinase family hexose kinase [Vallitaleaceae bacterium 9-2]
MITTVTLNPAIDKIVEIEQMSLGKVHRISNMVKTLGGKSINVSRVLSGLEIANKAVCFVGEENLEQVKKYAQLDGIDIDMIRVDGSTRTNVKVVEPDNDYRTTDLNEPGCMILQEQLEAMTDKIIHEYGESEFVVLSGSLPQGVGQSYYAELVKKLKTKTHMVVDADQEILMKSIQEGPYLIKPNIHELEAAVGKTLDTLDAIKSECRELIKNYAITYILVSMGEDGSLLVSQKHCIKADIIKVKVVSTVGAGDSMLAGFIYGLKTFSDEDELIKLKKAMQCATASSSIAIETQDHVQFSKEKLLERSQKVLVTNLG